MALLWVHEHATQPVDANGNEVTAPGYPALARHRVDFSAAPGTGTPLGALFSDQTRFVQLYADTACQVELGPSGVATDDKSIPIAANGRLLLGIDRAAIATLAVRAVA